MKHISIVGKFFIIMAVFGVMALESPPCWAPAGLDAEELAERMDEPAAQDLLDEATANAVSRGVFGAPTLFVGDEMFFGNDRLHFMQGHLARAA
ncbi:DsbA family protein [Rhizobium leguminosarum]|uniref:DsbA family protein n=1 Tax=Rhizobium leguminosarum TaxID=384 RepID=UPI0028F40DB3|nr:DsbA family protein [Rhizobium leguminosarum]